MTLLGQGEVASVTGEAATLALAGKLDGDRDDDGEKGDIEIGRAKLGSVGEVDCKKKEV